MFKKIMCLLTKPIHHVALCLKRSQENFRQIEP